MASSSIPLEWRRSARYATKGQLREARKQSNLPDPSFDVDGDGHVSQQDLFIANRFDFDRDGKLSREERAAVDQAVAQGVMDKFLWLSEPGGRGVRAARPDELSTRNQAWFVQEQQEPKTRTRQQILEERKQAARAANAAKHAAAMAKASLRPKPKLKWDELTNSKARPWTTPVASPTESSQPTRPSPHTTDVAAAAAAATQETAAEGRRYATQREMIEERRRQIARDNEFAEVKSAPTYKPKALRQKLKEEQQIARSRAAGDGKTKDTLAEERRLADLALSQHFADKSGQAKNQKDMPIYQGQDVPFFVPKENAQARYFLYPDELEQEKHEPHKQYWLTQVRQQRQIVASKVTEKVPEIDKKGQLKQRHTAFTTSIFDHKGFDIFVKRSESGQRRLEYEETKKLADEQRWCRESTSSYAQLPMYSSFSRDGIFREPSYVHLHNARMPVEYPSSPLERTRPCTATIGDNVPARIGTMGVSASAPVLQTMAHLQRAASSLPRPRPASPQGDTLLTLGHSPLLARTASERQFEL